MVLNISDLSHSPLPDSPAASTSHSNSIYYHHETLSYRFDSRPALTAIMALFDNLAKGHDGTVARSKVLVTIQSKDHIVLIIPTARSIECGLKRTSRKAGWWSSGKDWMVRGSERQ